ncbi:family 16 glycoside hydrolase [Singulisphaera sp. PoT]|uniref:family 16 glycoside hydrolase n=1 Tax=Singulisphaera sp. PoT TaxID=3411797 RepID=UPI003BF5EB65
MKRIGLGMTAWALLLVPSVYAQSTEDLVRTAALVASYQNSDGGFGPKPSAPSTLSTTSTAIRILKNTKGAIPDVLACIKFVKSCYDPSTGGFAPTPGGEPSVGITASGLMAIAELKIPADDYAKGAIEYFSKHAKEFEEIRIAAAGLEAVGKTSPDFEAWTKKVEAMRNSDGTFGKGGAQARDTGGATALLLRMGVKVDKKDAILQALRARQNADGAWSKADGVSELETSYRIMRTFYMLKETPDLEKLKGFIAKCRHSDGSYSSRPGGEGDLGGTYFATTIIRWIRLLSGEPAYVETAGFVPLFNGKDLTGWEGDKKLWSAKDGILTGTSPGLDHNDFLATEQSYGDFVLKLTFRLTGQEDSNSGVQFRSERIPGHEMRGYQADIGKGYWGSLYDESRRNKVLVQGDEKAVKGLNMGGWNEYVVKAIGNKITLTLNGVTSVKYTEEDPTIAREGKIAVQIHAGGPLKIEFKDVLIQPLPRPTPEQLETPGFHLRSLNTLGVDRKYSVFLPTKYDGKKTFPVILYLHGKGECGTDGALAAQVGLGPAILARPEAFPAIVVFPQARETWNSESDDTKAALAILDDVLANYKGDGERVVLTGYSMGGSGSWGLVASRPERFRAVVPVCGKGKPETAASFRSMPIWIVVGDEDKLETVQNARAMADTLKTVGSFPRHTEFRGVEHNSWDRAYNDPTLIDWLLAQSHR